MDRVLLAHKRAEDNNSDRRNKEHCTVKYNYQGSRYPGKFKEVCNTEINTTSYCSSFLAFASMQDAFAAGTVIGMNGSICIHNRTECV